MAEEPAAPSSSSRKRPAPEGDRPPAPAPKKRYNFMDINEDYEVLEVIGHGAFGLVAKARRRSTGEMVAVKCVRNYGSAGPDLDAFVREAGCMYGCRGHPYIVDMIDVATNPGTGHLYIIMELVRGPSLRAWLKRPVPEPRARDFMRQLLSAAERMHRAPYVTLHRDIKPDNILVAGGGAFGGGEFGGGEVQLKICDFGCATPVRRQGIYLEGPVGTPQYAAPEMMSRNRCYGTAVDIWALGCVMVELLTAAPLFYGTTEEEMMLEIKDLHQGSDGIGSKAFQEMLGLSPAGIDLLTGLLKLDPADRLTAPEALKHPWFTEEEAAAPEPAAKAESPGLDQEASDSCCSSSNSGA